VTRTERARGPEKWVRNRHSHSNITRKSSSPPVCRRTFRECINDWGRSILEWYSCCSGCCSNFCRRILPTTRVLCCRMPEEENIFVQITDQWRSLATRNKCIATSNKCLTSRNKKLLETSALLVVTSALLVETRSY